MSFEKTQLKCDLKKILMGLGKSLRLSSVMLDFLRVRIVVKINFFCFKAVCFCKGSIIRKGVPATLFLRHPTFDLAFSPLFKIFASPLLLFVPPPFKVFKTVPPTLPQPPPALIQYTNIPYR